jgi:hypothetical protein
MSQPLWWRDREALALLALRYFPWFAALNLMWETAQLPLYTIWTDATYGEIAFAVFHCTLVDVLIGATALAITLTLTRTRAPEDWRWVRIAILLVLLGAAYTAFSEWMNTTLLRWAYSALMPTLNLGGIKIGLSPLAQWVVVPLLALYLTRSSVRSEATGK